MPEHIRHADGTPDLPEEQRLSIDAKNLIQMAEVQSIRLNRQVDPIILARREDENTAALQAAIDRERQNVSPAVGAVMTEEEATDRVLEKSPEQQWFADFETRFNDRKLAKLHEGIAWEDVKKCLEADTELVRNLMAFDAKGHRMNVFGEEGDEFIFASAWNEYSEVSPDHRNISFDTEGERFAKKLGWNPSGNAVKIIADIIGVKEKEAAQYLADPALHMQLLKVIAVNGVAYLKTDAATRAAGGALIGRGYGFSRVYAHYYNDSGSFRAVLRGKKAA